MATKELTLPTNAPTVFTDGILASIGSYADVLKMFESAGVQVESMEDYGTGFHVVTKTSLIGVPMMLVEWRFNKSELNDGGFVSVAAVTAAGDKVIFNDGSTGILSQLKQVTSTRLSANLPTPQAGLIVPTGLTKSEYDYTDDKGKTIPASTFYLGN